MRFHALETHFSIPLCFLKGYQLGGGHKNPGYPNPIGLNKGKPRSPPAS
nr:MAG TPA: hypothetical protein [Caudoviricetes sp.]